MNNISEFMTLEKKEKAQVIYEITDTIAKETELPLEIVCKIVADYKNWSVNQVKRYLNLYDENYLLVNVMYQDGKLIKKEKFTELCYNILKEKLLNIIESSPYMVPASTLKQILNDYATEIKW